MIRLLIPLIGLLVSAVAAQQWTTRHAIDGYQELAVPFTSQAPLGTWEEPWQNACEETVIAMLRSYYGAVDFDADSADEAILSVFDLKNEESTDESMYELEKFINNASFVWQSYVVDNPSIYDLKEQVFLGNPVIAPVFAQQLDNPYYIDGGPDYHVVLIVGYDDQTNEFIVHDPGTQRGESFRYSYESMMTALHDFVDTNDYQAGASRVLFTKLRNL